MLDTLPIQILLVEDDAVTRLAIKLGLGSFPQVKVEGEASDGREAVAMANDIKPDLILMDIGLPIMDGLEATRVIKNSLPKTKILMFTSHESEAEHHLANCAGADGYCLKSLPIDKLVWAITTIFDSVTWAQLGLKDTIIDTRLCLKLFPNPSKIKTESSDKLTPA